MLDVNNSACQQEDKTTVHQSNLNITFKGFFFHLCSSRISTFATEKLLFYLGCF